MTDELFNPDAFEQIPGQMSLEDRTWDGEPLWSPDSVAEQRYCEICLMPIEAGEKFSDDGSEIAHDACTRDWFRRNFGREGLS